MKNYKSDLAGTKIPFRVASYTFATLPVLTTRDTGALAWCTDWSGGARLIVWNGTVWEAVDTTSGGGINNFAGMVDFGTYNTDAILTASAGWITLSSKLMISPFGNTPDHNAEETVIEQIQFICEPPTVGSVVVRGHAPNGTSGKHGFVLIGV